ncbi:MAG: GNAT family N-acetyltransferase [Anaerolineae bacterium]|nr:GNAT family N-acetyltransferase [Anaerolineae bacterium]
MRYSIRLGETPDLAASEFVRGQLRAYNLAHTGETAYQDLQILARDEQGEIIGGLLGRIQWDWLEVGILWVAEHARGAGLGSALLRAAEAEARRANAYGATLDTAGWQALGFYLKHGYHVFGELENRPVGFTHYYLRKTFTAGGAEAE